MYCVLRATTSPSQSRAQPTPFFGEISLLREEGDYWCYQHTSPRKDARRYVCRWVAIWGRVPCVLSLYEHVFAGGSHPPRVVLSLVCMSGRAPVSCMCGTACQCVSGLLGRLGHPLDTTACSQPASHCTSHHTRPEGTMSGCSTGSLRSRGSACQTWFGFGAIGQPAYRLLCYIPVEPIRHR